MKIISAKTKILSSDISLSKVSSPIGQDRKETNETEYTLQVSLSPVISFRLMSFHYTHHSVLLHKCQQQLIKWKWQLKINKPNRWNLLMYVNFSGSLVASMQIITISGSEINEFSYFCQRNINEDNEKREMKQ